MILYGYKFVSETILLYVNLFRSVHVRALNDTL
jgi:hypothetical protein